MFRIVDLFFVESFRAVCTTFGSTGLIEHFVKHGGENLGLLSIDNFTKLVEKEIKKLITIKKET